MRRICVYILLIITLLPSHLVGQEVFRVGLIRYKTSETFWNTYKPLMDYVGKELGRKVIMDTVPEDELAYRMSQGQYDLGVFTPFPYLRAKIDFPELEVFASHTVNGEDSYSGCIMIREESGIRSLHQLKEHSFLFVKPSSTSGYKYPKGIFKERNLDVDAGFFEYDFSGGHARSLKALMSKEVDGIAVDTRVYEGLTATEKMDYNMLECYKIPYHAYVMAPTMDSILRTRLKEAMFQAHKNPGNRKIFQNPLNIEKWHPQTDAAYNSLRRYLRIVREKPSVHITWEIRTAAKRLLDERGDLLNILQDACLNKLRSTHRFKQVSDQEIQMEDAREIKITLGFIDGHLHYYFYLQDEQIGEGNLDDRNLVKDFPQKLVSDVLRAHVIDAQLLYNGVEWFITYGSDDGIVRENYHFEVKGPGNEKKILTGEDIKDITPLNTIFNPIKDFTFQEGYDVNVLYRGPGSNNENSIGSGLGINVSFWDNLDNRWGVVGLVVTFLLIAFGSYFSTRRKRRFQHYLRGSNDLLLNFLVNNQNIDADLLSQKHSIHTSLQKGRITENQFLILNKRVEDVERIVHEDFPEHKVLDKKIQEELDEICSNGIISEKEFSRILILTRKQQGRGNS